MQNPKGSLLGSATAGGALWGQSWLQHRTLFESSCPWQHLEDLISGKTHLDLTLLLAGEHGEFCLRKTDGKNVIPRE